MSININITDSLAIIKEHQAIINKEVSKMSEEFAAATDGLLTLCAYQYYDRIQLYHNTDKGSVADALNTLKGIADDGEVTKVWEDDHNTWHHFRISNKPFCIVLNKEVTK